MKATARAPLIRAGPGVSAWTALPERDRALLLCMVQGDVVTAELAALLSYGHRQIAQRRLRRLVEYGLLSGFWAANRQRPRDRYAYALTKIARAQLERLVWPLGKPKLDEGGIETVSPSSTSSPRTTCSRRSYRPRIRRPRLASRAGCRSGRSSA